MRKKRCCEILDENEIEYDKRVVSELIIKHFADFRRILNELQRYAASGKIDIGILSTIEEVNVNELVNYLKSKKFSEMRKWANSNMDTDIARVFRKMYDVLNYHLKPQSVPQAVLIIADYQYKSAFVADQEINLVACLTEIMVECEFK